MVESEKIATEGERSKDRGVARRQAFLRAARDVFLEHGYEAASVNDVVGRAGGSLATLYSQFGSKEGLFQAFVKDQFEKLKHDFTAADVEHLPLEQGLVILGEQLLTVILQPENVAFHRLLVNEGRKFPELMQKVVVSGSEETRHSLRSYLRERSIAEGRPIADPEEAAQYFIALVRSRHQFNAITDPSFSLEPDPMRVHVRATVTFFLNGALPRT